MWRGDTATSGGSRLQQAALDRHRHRLGAGIDRQLVEDRSEVIVDGARGDEEPPPDDLAGESLGHQPQHLVFPFGQWVLACTCDRWFFACSWLPYSLRGLRIRERLGGLFQQAQGLCGHCVERERAPISVCRY